MVFALLLYGLFALLSLLLVLIGAQVYRSIVRQTEARSDTRASLSYVANKIRSAEEARLETREGVPVLVLPEQAGEQTYETLIYFYDGLLRELFQREEDAFLPANGEELTPLQAFTMEESPGGAADRHFPRRRRPRPYPAHPAPPGLNAADGL